MPIGAVASVTLPVASSNCEAGASAPVPFSEVIVNFENQVLVRPHPRPELQLGFTAMRRREIISYAKKYGVDVNENTPKEGLVNLMDAYVSQGKVPHPYQPDEHPLLQKAKDMEKENQELRDRLERVEGMLADIAVKDANLMKAMNSSGIPIHSGSGTVDPMTELRGNLKPVVVVDVQDMSWTQLLKYAKSRGVRAHGLKRDELLEALK